MLFLYRIASIPFALGERVSSYEMERGKGNYLLMPTSKRCLMLWCRAPHLGPLCLLLPIRFAHCIASRGARSGQKTFLLELWSRYAGLPAQEKRMSMSVLSRPSSLGRCCC